MEQEQQQQAAGAYSVVAFGGSMRAASSNRGLVKLAERIAPPELRITVTELPSELPFYNDDLESNPPASVRQWRALVEGADALLIGMPEYNFGPSAMAKNAIDWVSRPYGGHTLRNKVIAMITSAGKGGGSKVQDAISPILGILGNTVVTDPLVQIALGGGRIDADGNTEDAEIEAAVAAKLAAMLSALDAAHQTNA